VDVVGIMTVPRIEVVLCDLDSFHSGDSSGEKIKSLDGRFAGFPGVVIGRIASLQRHACNVCRYICVMAS
jgi:hypothetical protein